VIPKGIVCANEQGHVGQTIGKPMVRHLFTVLRTKVEMGLELSIASKTADVSRLSDYETAKLFFRCQLQKQVTRATGQLYLSVIYIYLTRVYLGQGDSCMQESYI
jgi:hypothetical protein